MKDPTGPKAIRGIGDDECDDKPANAIAGEDDTSDNDYAPNGASGPSGCPNSSAILDSHSN